jgi:hypothetical protein
MHNNRKNEKLCGVGRKKPQKGYPEKGKPVKGKRWSVYSETGAYKLAMCESICFE